MISAENYFSDKAYIWLWVPLAFLVFKIGAEFMLPDEMLWSIYSENGYVELLQAALLICGLIVAVKILWQGRKAVSSPLKIWIGLAAICCLYVAGEELSWGQHMFEWATPETWQGINDQKETNLHNTSSWLDQKPRLILLVGTVVGGLIIPLLQGLKKQILPSIFTVIYPTYHFAVTAVMVLVIKMLDKLEKLTSINIFQRVSELEELYMYYFVFMYLLLMHARLLGAKK